MQYRDATIDDAIVLAEMNLKLIQDEGHSNPMSVKELAGRMRSWLERDYRAVIFGEGRKRSGYALWRPEPEGIYLRQFFVARSKRRKGVGRAAMEWLLANKWQEIRRIRLEVLSGNAGGISFWKAVGFSEYCMTMIRRGRGYRET